MKKILFVLCICIVSIGLCAEIDQRKPFMDYYKNPNFSNVLKAVAFYGNQIELDSTNMMNKIYLLNLYNMEMSSILNDLIENADSLNPGEAFQTANMLLSLHQYEDAIKIYNRINAKTPNWSCPWRHKGEALLKLEDYQNSEISLRKAIETRKDHYDAYLMLAEVLYKQNKNKEAFDIFTEGSQYAGQTEASEETVYNQKQTDLLYINILKANKMKKELKKAEEKFSKKYKN